MDKQATRDGWRKSTRSGSTECVEVKVLEQSA
ncbi:DUF397 domain-containing protein [Actinoallomurus sp. NBC_01490]|jgi:hypothetical protein